MKTSPDFQTGSILLLTATLICIGLAIAVIAPIIDSPLAGSTVADTTPSDKADAQPRTQGHPLVGFYPPIARAKHELKRSQEMTGATVYQASQQPRKFVPASTTTLVETRNPAPLQAVSVATNTTPPEAVIPTNFPHSTVYAPITIHQPAANSASTGREIADVAERIERLVTERERLASAFEIEKQRQSEIARRTRRQQAAEFQQQQIARLEQELKLLNQSMTNLQSETSTQFSRLTEQNSQIDVASQALDAYREALKIARIESARSAGQNQLRTAEAAPKLLHDFESSRQNQDNAGRVQIPILPPIPSHQHRQPAPLQPVEQAPQTADAPLKRLRVSAPTRIFEAPTPEPKRRFLPLPTAGEESSKTPAKTTSEAAETTSSTFHTTVPARMEFIPLEAPTIREFQINRGRKTKPEIKSKNDAKRQRKQARIPQQIKTTLVPDLNVAFEHTYQFESIPIVQDATEEDVTEIIISTINLDVPRQTTPEQTSTFEKKTPFQFEAIEFPDLSIVNRSEPKLKGPLRDVTIQKPNVAPRKNLPNQLKPVVAAALRPEPQRQPKARPRTDSKPLKQKSWIQRVSGALNPLGNMDTSRSTKPAQSTSRPNAGARGQNRHLQRKPTEKKRLTLAGFSPDRKGPDASEAAIQKPNMLQRIGNTLQSVSRPSE